MTIGLNGSVVDPLFSPSPPSYGVLVFPIHSLVAQSGLEFPVDEMFDCKLPRSLVLKNRRSWWAAVVYSGLRSFED